MTRWPAPKFQTGNYPRSASCCDEVVICQAEWDALQALYNASMKLDLFDYGFIPGKSDFSRALECIKKRVS